MNMNRSDYINGIIYYIRGLSGINYQKAIGNILSTYYAGHKTYEMPSALGGDDKNDGWVEEDAIFYQVFSPVQISTSFRLAIQEKFASDLEGLIDIVYNQHKWGSVVNEFIFLVNTRDENLPKDPTRFYETKKEELRVKYSVSNEIIARVVNDSYIYDILFELEDMKLEQIATKLNIGGLVNFNHTSAVEIVTFIDLIADAIQEKTILDGSSNYKRISSNKKIEINDLLPKQERINKIIPKLSIVDDAIQHFAQSINSVSIFELVKNKYIELYEDLSANFSGVELYDKILKSILSFAPTLQVYNLPAEMVLVYIFDRCDIFKKEC